MTTPGGTQLGTAYGKVRIDYESTGVGRATKDVEALQHSMVDAGKSATQSAKQIDRAQGVISQAVLATTKTLEKGLNVSAPINVSATKVEINRGSITKAISNFKDVKRQHIQVATGVKLFPTQVDIDKGAITKAINTFSQQGIGNRIKLKTAVDIEANDISVNTGVIENALRSTSLGEITLTTPIRIEPSQVTVNQGAIQRGAQGSAGTLNLPGGQGSSGGDSGGGSGAMGALAGGAMLARLGPMGAAAGAVALPLTAISTVLSKGFTRLQGLDQAAVKLKALGKSTEEIAAISETSLKSVEGTAFGLDEAFNVAAGAMNAGVKEGADLEKYMNAVAGTAALAGVSMLELGDAMQQAAVEGKVTGDVLDLLISRNVPALKLISDEYGVTQQKAQEMVSNSEVSFDRFVNAMSKNKEAAKLMANTVGGSFSNLMASVSRIGAMLLAPLFGKATGEASTMAQVIQGLTEKLKQFEGFLKQNQGTIITVWENAGKGALLFAQHMTNVVGWVLEGFGKILEGVGWLATALSDLAGAVNFTDTSDKLEIAGRNMGQWGKNVFEAGQNVHDFEQTLDKGLATLENWANGARESAGATGALAGAAGQAGPPLVSLNEVLEKLGLKAEDVSEAVTGTNQEFLKMMETLEKKNAPKELTAELTKMRDAFVNGGRAAESYETALENMSDTTLEASDRAGALIDSLKQLGILPGGDALADYNEQFEKMTSYARELPDPLGNLGRSLVNLDGTINSGEGNGRKLLGVIEEARQAMYSLAASGEVPAGEAFARTSEGLRLVLQDYGLMGKEADDLINKYLSGGQGQQFFEAQFTGKTPKDIVEEGFASDPAKIESILKLMTTQEDILNELLGGPGSALKIPAIIDVPAGAPVTPTTPVGGGAGQNIPPEGVVVPGVAPPGMEVRKFPNGAIIPVPIGGKPAAPLQPKLPEPTKDEGGFDWSNPFGLGTTPGSVETKLTPTSLEGKTDAELRAVIDQTDADTQQLLNVIVDNARLSGKSVSQAFAEGINSESEEVRNAIIELARIAGDGLGNSPAKYGPLSGKGYSLYRGKALTNAFAEGIVSESANAKAAVSSMTGSATLPFGSSVEQLVKDMSEMSGLGKMLLDFGKSLGDLAFQGLSMANDLSSGRLFPKSYIKDPNKVPGGSALPSWNPTRNATPGAPFSMSAASSATAPGKGQIPLVQNADGTWTSSDPEWAKLIKRESGGNPTIVQGVQDVNSGGNEATGLFQIAKGTWESNGGLEFAPNAKDATPQQQAQIAAKIFADQGGSPWGSGANQNFGRENEDLLRAGLTDGSSPAASIFSPANMDLGLTSGFKALDDAILSQVPAGSYTNAPGDLQKGLADCSSAVEDLVNIMDSQPTAGRSLSTHNATEWLTERGFLPTDAVVAGAMNVAFNSGHMQATLPGGTNFNWGSDSAAALGGRTSQGAYDEALTSRFYRPAGNLPAGSQPGTPNNPLNVTMPEVTGSPMIPPGLSEFSGTLGNTPKTQQEAVSWLQSIDAQIADQNKLGTPESKARADALGTARSQQMNRFGLQEGPSGLDQAQGIFNGIAGVTGDVLAVVDATIASIGAANDISGRLVRGIANTKDVMDTIDNIQTFIDLGAKIAQAVSSTTGLAAQIAGAGGADPTGAGGAASGALSAISGISGMVSAGLQAVNAGIDIAQEVYRITTKYVGRFIQSWTGLEGASDVKYLLDEMTGQVMAYSSDNPQMKSTFNTLGRSLGKEYPGRPAPTNNFTIYQGPGQDPRDTMDDAMFTVRSSGVGAFGYAD